MTQEERRSKDRRRAPTPLPVGRNALNGRRMSARRGDEDKNYYVDRYHVKYLLITIGVVFFCLLDAFLTLGLVQKGGIEFNPIMDFLIKKNTVLFLVVKTCLTALCIIFFLVHKNFRVFGRLKINFLIYTTLSFYVLLIFYELYLYVANRLI
jgi:hypothetical protein